MKNKSPTQARTAGVSLIEYDNIAFNEEERHAWSYFLKAYKVATEGVDKSLRENSPLSLAEFEILHKVGLTGGRIRFIDLARITLLSQSRISRQIDALQAKGFLRREITASDNRATLRSLQRKVSALWRRPWNPSRGRITAIFLTSFRRDASVANSQAYPSIIQSYCSRASTSLRRLESCR
jgi:DNA-binding MarR family transcriptional regulator